MEGARVFPNPAADTAVNQLSDQFHITANWVHIFNNSKSNDLHYNYNRRTNYDPMLYPSTIAGDAGLSGVALDGTPTITVAGYSQIGPGGQYRLAGPGFQHQITEALSWTHDRHQIKIGGEWRSSEMTDSWGDSRSGAFNFNDVATGSGYAVAALLLGWTNSVSVNSGITDTRMNYFAGYIQDDWKVTPRLTLNIGLRWDMDTPRSEAHNHQSGFDPTAINPVSGTPGAITYAGKDGVSVYAHRFDTNNFAPRFGLAWRPVGDKFVIRAAYGLMFGPIYDDSLSRANVTGFGDVRQFQSSNNGLTPALILSSGVPGPSTASPGPGFGAVPVGQATTTSPDFYLTDQRAPYSHQFNLTLQRQIFGTMLLEGAYIGNLSHDVGARDTNVNEIRPELRGAVQDQRFRPFPQYSNVILRGPNWGNSSYHAMTLKAEKRFSRGLNLLTTYTWSKFIDDVEAANEGGGAPGNGQQSYYARHLDKSLSGNDIRHRWASSAVYELPFHLENKMSNAFIGGWSLGVIGELRSGRPYGVVEQTNRLNAFSASQRPNVTGDPSLPSDRPRSELIQQWFNTSAFVFPGNGVIGNAARNIGIGPGAINVDVSLMKDFHISEGTFFQLRAESYNAINRPNFGLPNGQQGSAAFGTISSADDGRQIQLGLKLVF